MQDTLKIQAEIIRYERYEYMQPFLSSRHFTPRCPPYLLVMGGTILGSVHRPTDKCIALDIAKLYEKDDDFNMKLPEASSGAATVSIGNFLFVFGGRLATNSSSNAYRFDISKKRWLQLAKMPSEASFQAYSRLDKKIFLMCGIDKNNKACTSVYAYDVENNEIIRKLAPNYVYFLPLTLGGATPL